MAVSPYYDSSFLGFFKILFQRIYAFCLGANLQLTTDELQILILSLIAIVTACLGSFLVLRRMTMLTNALSHTILVGIVLAYFIYCVYQKEQTDFDFSHLLPSESILICAALIMAFLTNFLTQLLVNKLKMREDTSCGVVFTALFAAGVILVTFLSRDAHIGTELLMGSVDALHFDDLLFQWRVTLFNIVLVIVFYRAFFMTTFDPLFSKLLGVSSILFGYLLMGQTAIVAIAAFRAVGVLLVLTFFVGPVLIARLWTNHLMRLMLCAVLIGVGASLAGVALSRHCLSTYSLAVSTSGVVVCVISALYFLSIGIKIGIKGFVLLRSPKA